MEPTAAEARITGEGTLTGGLAGTPANLTLSFASNAAASDTVQIGSTTYTFVSTLAAANDVLIGAAASDTASNLVAAITAGTGEGTTYGTGTVAHTDVTAAIGDTNTEVVLTARDAGTAGNAIAVDVESATAEARITGEGTLTGGLDSTPASLTLTSDANSKPKDTIEIGSTTYTFVLSLIHI